MNIRQNPGIRTTKFLNPGIGKTGRDCIPYYGFSACCRPSARNEDEVDQTDRSVCGQYRVPEKVDTPKSKPLNVEAC